MREALLSIWFVIFAVSAAIAAYWLFQFIVGTSRVSARPAETPLHSRRSHVRRRLVGFGLATLAMGLGFIVAVSIW